MYVIETFRVRPIPSRYKPRPPPVMFDRISVRLKLAIVFSVSKSKPCVIVVSVTKMYVLLITADPPLFVINTLLTDSLVVMMLEAMVSTVLFRYLAQFRTSNSLSAVTFTFVKATVNPVIDVPLSN